jgi:hypothetical protein
MHRMIEWNSNMDEAPRDGTEILITDGEGTYAVVRWDDYAVESCESGWRDYGDMGWGGMVGQQPTAWASINAPASI